MQNLTTTKLESLKKDINFLSRVLRDLLMEDYEAAEAMERTIANMQTTILEIELDAQPSTVVHHSQ